MADKEPAKATDYLKKIGRNLNSKNAAEIFGKGNVQKVFDALERTGLYGRLSPLQQQNGVIIPKDGTAVQKEKRAQINNALNSI